MYHKGDTKQECAMDFLSHWVSFMCHVYSIVLAWCFQIVISMKHAKWQQMVVIKAKWQLNTTTTW